MATKNVKDETARPVSRHYAVLERPMNRQAFPCYCNKKKDHPLTPRTPRIDDFGEIWGGPEFGFEKVVLSERGFIKVTPQPRELIKHETPVFAEVQREHNARVAGFRKAEGLDYR